MLSHGQPSCGAPASEPTDRRRQTNLSQLYLWPWSVRNIERNSTINQTLVKKGTIYDWHVKIYNEQNNYLLDALYCSARSVLQSFGVEPEPSACSFTRPPLVLYQRRLKVKFHFQLFYFLNLDFCSSSRMEVTPAVVDLEDLQVPGADPVRLNQDVVLPKRYWKPRCSSKLVTHLSTRDYLSI